MSNTSTYEWRTHAACRDADPDLFFPIGTSGPALTQAEEAKAVCRTCPVQATCLEWALESGQDHGIWGGLDEHEREASRHRPAAQAAERPAQVKQPVAAEPPADDDITARRQEVFARRTIDAGEGHREWQGAEPVTIGATRYTARKLSWLIEHGVPPEGKLLVACGHTGCVTAVHLQDTGRPATGCGTRNGYLAHLAASQPACPDCLHANAEQTEGTRRRRRAAVTECGTRGGYQKHRRQGETPCTPCRQANSDADRRLRNTGTTLAAA